MLSAYTRPAPLLNFSAGDYRFAVKATIDFGTIGFGTKTAALPDSIK